MILHNIMDDHHDDAFELQRTRYILNRIVDLLNEVVDLQSNLLMMMFDNTSNSNVVRIEEVNDGQ